MKYVNKLEIVGRMGKDPEIRYTHNGSTVAAFSVAVEETYQDKKSTEWFRCKAFKGAAEKVQEFAKGNWIKVIGKVQTEKWTAKDGTEKEAKVVIAFVVCSPDDQPKAQAQPEPATDDVPF